MNYKRIYSVKIVTRDPEYYVGRIMVLSFAVLGFLSVVTEGAIWMR